MQSLGGRLSRIPSHNRPRGARRPRRADIDADFPLYVGANGNVGLEESTGQ
jgi:hypothetical protein